MNPAHHAGWVAVWMSPLLKRTTVCCGCASALRPAAHSDITTHVTTKCGVHVRMMCSKATDSL